jgi:hypothetical protein
MSSLNLLTVDQIQARSRSNIVKQTEVGTLEYYIQVAENILDAQGLNKTKEGYAVNVGYAVLLFTEFLILQDQEHILVALASPFSEERMGSYSYKIKQIEQIGWPATVERILKMYRSAGDVTKLIITTRVFPEFKPDSTTGFRPIHDLVNGTFYEEEQKFRPQP